MGPVGLVASVAEPLPLDACGGFGGVDGAVGQKDDEAFGRASLVQLGEVEEGSPDLASGLRRRRESRRGSSGGVGVAAEEDSSRSGEPGEVPAAGGWVLVGVLPPGQQDQLGGWQQLVQ